MEKKDLYKNLPDEEVVVKMSICNKCNGVVRTAVVHLMTASGKKEFMNEVSKHNLNIKHQPLLEYRKDNPKWCDCK